MKVYPPTPKITASDKIDSVDMIGGYEYCEASCVCNHTDG